MVTGEPVKLLSVLFGATVSETVIFCTDFQFDDNVPLQPDGTFVATQYGAGALLDVCCG